MYMNDRRKLRHTPGFSGIFGETPSRQLFQVQESIELQWNKAKLVGKYHRFQHEQQHPQRGKRMERPTKHLENLRTVRNEPNRTRKHQGYERRQRETNRSPTRRCCQFSFQDNTKARSPGTIRRTYTYTTLSTRFAVKGDECSDYLDSSSFP